jgi:hypothetical protein
MAKTDEDGGKKPIRGAWSLDVQPFGKLRGPNTLFLRSHVGEVKVQLNGREEVLELSCGGIGQGSPIVRCNRTRQWFTLSWEDIATMALDAGICAEQPEMEGK